MKYLTVCYNPYTYEWKIWETINNKNIELGEGNSLRNYNKQFFCYCFDQFIYDILNEYNDHVTLKFYSRDLECQLLMNYIVRHNLDTIHLSTFQCPLKKSVQERLKELNALCKQNYGRRYTKNLFRVNVYLDEGYTKYADIVNSVVIGNSFCEVKCVASSIFEYHYDTDRRITNVFLTDNTNPSDFNVDGMGFVLKQGQDLRLGNKINNLLFIDFDTVINGLKLVLFLKTLTEVLALAKEEMDNIFRGRQDYRQIYRVEPEVIIEPVTYVEVGDTAAINHKVYPNVGPSSNLVYVVDNPEVLSVDGNRIKGKAAGTAIIRVWELGAFQPLAEFSCRVEKVIRTSEIQMVRKITVPAESSQRFSIGIVPKNAEDIREIRIYSTNPLVAIYEKGNLIGKNSGMASIMVEAPRCSARCDVTVINRLAQIVPSVSEIRIKEKECAYLSYTVIPAQYYEESIYVTSSNPAVAEYAAGEVLGKKTGVAIISFRSTRGIVGECKVIVSPEDTPLMKAFNKVADFVRREK